jgi:hypothetical protein
MTQREELLILADRCEREEASSMLDWAIHEALRFDGASPAYTISLDAAVTLTNWCIAHLSEIGGDGLPMCVLTDGVREATGYCLNSPTSGVTALARAASAAGLRARALSQTDGAEEGQ